MKLRRQTIFRRIRIWTHKAIPLVANTYICLDRPKQEVNLTATHVIHASHVDGKISPLHRCAASTVLSIIDIVNPIDGEIDVSAKYNAQLDRAAGISAVSNEFLV